MAFELGTKDWKLGFSTGLGVGVRLRAIGGGNLAVLRREIELAGKKFKLTDDARVCSCYEAGRDGFWLHRWLMEQGIDNVLRSGLAVAPFGRIGRSIEPYSSPASLATRPATGRLPSS
jgi:hypothetical protein